MRRLLAAGCLAVASLAIVVLGQTATSQRQSSGSTGPEASSSNTSSTTPSAAPAEAQRALINQYCVGCHSQKAKSAGMDSARRLTLDDVDIANVGEHAEVWERVVRRLRAGMMPPQGSRRPDEAAYKGLIAWLENELDRNAQPYFPAPGVHRLNRTEYANAIRDLLDLEIDPAKYLPSDDSTRGFDNIAGALGVSSTLVEAYVSAAGKISRLALGEATTPHLVVYRVPEDTAQNYHIEGLPFGTRGGLLVDHIFPSDGEYTITVTAVFADNMAGEGFGSVPGEKIEILLDGERLALLDWAGRSRGGAAPMRVRFATTAGPHSVGATFVQTNLAPLLDLNRQFERDTIQTGPTPGYTFFPHVGSIRIEGPYNALTAQESPSRRKIFLCQPAGASDEQACARKIITNLATQAFRAPATAEDLDMLMAFYQQGRKERDFEHGIERALARILAAPKFIYRIEGAASGSAGQAYRLSDLELASRLSYFLWSAAPDEQLLNLASQGRLKDPAVLEQQVQRLLADPRSEALAVNFAGQWLNLRDMGAVGPLPMIYPDFDDPLRRAMRREVELLFDSIVREDRSVIDLLTADYTFVDERLAKHYGFPGVYGSQFRRVTLGPEFDARRGLLGKGAILTTTSRPERNKPVARGQWVLKTIIGVQPPDPPTDIEIPALPERKNTAAGDAKEPTLRALMEEHRKNPACTGCHKLMDPIGFSLENFDAIGAWRTMDGVTPVHAADVLYDGTKVNGVADLRQWLVGRSDVFMQAMTEKLLTYALGRGVEYQDMPLVRRITREAASQNNRFSAIVMGIVKSDAFQMNMKPKESE